MNLRSCLCMLLAAGAPAGFSAAEPTPPVPVRDALRHEDLVEGYAKVEEAARKPEFAQPPAQPLEYKQRKPVSLLERSEFLSFNGRSTLVPKGSLLNVPPNLKARNQMVAGNPIVPWAEFFRRNRGWISTMEVSRKQAEADEPLSEETLKAIAKNPLVVVATMAGGPITVLREPAAQAAPEAAPAAAAAQATAAANPNTSTKPVK